MSFKLFYILDQVLSDFYLHSVFLMYIIGQVEEVYSFSQDDLLTEDILILDTHAEVFVWVGQSVDSKEKQNAFEIGQVLNLFGLLSYFHDTMLSQEAIFFFRNT